MSYGSICFYIVYILFHHGSHYFTLRNSHDFGFHTHFDLQTLGRPREISGDPAARALHSSTFCPGHAAAPSAPPTNAADAPGVPPAAKDGSAKASAAGVLQLEVFRVSVAWFYGFYVRKVLECHGYTSFIICHSNGKSHISSIHG